MVSCSIIIIMHQRYLTAGLLYDDFDAMRSIWKYGAMGGCYDALHSGSSCSVLLIMVRWVIEFLAWMLMHSVRQDIVNSGPSGRDCVLLNFLTFHKQLTVFPYIVSASKIQFIKEKIEILWQLFEVSTIIKLKNNSFCRNYIRKYGIFIF